MRALWTLSLRTRYADNGGRPMDLSGDEPMRFRMVHQLALLLLASAGLTALAVAGAVLLTLRGGFQDYVQARESQQLDRLAAYLGERPARLAGTARELREAIDDFAARDGGPESPADARPEGAALPLRRTDFADRIRLFDNAGVQVAGRFARPEERTLSRRIVDQGRVLGMAQLELASSASGLDASFLHRQYRGIAVATLLSLAPSMGVAVWLARRWSRPLCRLQAATRDLAAGRFAQDDALADGPSEIADLSQGFGAMAESLRKLEMTRRKWMAQISHELRTPLSVLQGEIESVEDGVREPGHALVASLGEEVRHMVRIVDDLHLLAVADLGRLPCHPIRLDPLHTLDYLVTRLARHPALDGLAVEWRPPPARALQAHWDPVRIEQVLRNLVVNSARYTDRPGRVQLSWGVDPAATKLWLLVEDSAPSVDPHDLPHLFEPLFRADRSRQRHDGDPAAAASSGGSGLGLAIVRAILLAHGGKASAEPSPLGGLAVRLELPLVQPFDTGRSA